MEPWLIWLIVLVAALAFLTLIMGVLAIIITYVAQLVLKMYTEYFKDISARNRKE